MAGVALIWDLITRDAASPGFNRVAASADRAAVATGRLTAAQRRVGASSAEAAAASKKAGGVLLAGAVAVGLSVKSALDYNSALAKMQAQARLTNKQVQQFSKSFMATSNATGVSAGDIATAFGHAYAALQKLGLKGPQAMNAVKTAAEGARMSGADFEDTLSSLDALMVAGYASSKNLSGAMGALNGIVASGHMSMEDLNAAISSGLLPAAKAGGVSLHELGAGLAVFGDMGVRGAKAGTQMRMVIQDLEKPAASAGDALHGIGLSMTSLSDTLQKHGLLAALQELSDHMTSAGITGSKMGTFLLDAFTKKAGTGIATLLEHMGPLKQALEDVTNRSDTFDKTWKTFSQTPAQRMAQLGQQFKNLGISIGTEALPYVVKFGNAIADALSFVSSHSSVFKPLALGVLAFAAAVKTASIINTFSTKISAFGTSLVDVSRKAFTAGGAIKSAFGGAAIGTSIGLMTRHASDGAKAVGALTSAAAGAAVGLSVGGPWGAAIGGGIGLLSDLATTLGGDSAAEERFKSGVADVTQALQANNGVIDQNIKKQVELTLQQNGTYEAAKRLGISTVLVTQAALDQKPAMAELNHELLDHSSALNRVGTSTASAIKGGQQFQSTNNDTAASTNAVNKSLQGSQADIRNIAHAYTGLSGPIKDQIAKSKQLNAINKSLGKTNHEVGDSAASVSKPLTLVNLSLSQQAIKADSVTTSLKKLNAALEKNISDELTAKSANLGFKESLLTLGEQVKTNGTSLSDNTAKGVANQQMLVGILQSADQAAHSTKNYGAAMLGNVQNLIKLTTQNGFARKSIMDLLAQMHLTPDEIKTKFETNADEEINTVGRLTRALQDLQNKTITYFVNGVFGSVSTTPSGQRHPGVKGGAVGSAAAWNRADGTIPPSTMGSVGERGAEGFVTDAGGRMKLFSHEQSVAMGMPPRGYAAGSVDATKAWLHSVNPLPYVFGAAGPGAYDCSGLVGAAIEHLTGQGSGRLFSTSNEGSVLPTLGFKPGAGSNAAMVVGWEHDSSLEHTTGSVGGLNFEAYGNEGVPLGKQIRVGGSARDPRTFPNVMHLDAAGGKPGGDPNSGSGGGGPSPKQQRRATNARDLRQARFGFESSQHPHKILERGGHFYFDGQSYATRALAEEAQREAQVTAAKSRAQAQRQRQMQELNSLRGGLNSFMGSFGSVASERKAFRGLLPDISKLGGDDKFIAKLKAQNGKLDGAIAHRNRIARALDKTKAMLAATVQRRNSLTSSVRSAVSGSFNLSSAGASPITGHVSAGGILAQEKQQLVLIKKWSAGILKLHKMGLSGPMLAQLAQGGPTTWPQVDALLHASPKVFREIMRDQRAINAAAKSVANRTGKEVYGQREHEERQREHREQRAEKRAEQRVAHLAQKIGDEIGKEFSKLHIEIKIDKKGMARVVRDGEKQMTHDRHHAK